MRISVINEPAEGSRLLLLKEWHLRLCEGHQGAAALLSHLIYWHEVRLENRQKAIYANDTAEKHGDRRTQDESLYQFHTEKELEQSLMIFSYKTIRDGIKYLENKGYISTHKNPNPRYAFDRTKFFLVNIDGVNEALAEMYPNRKGNSSLSMGNFSPRSVKTSPRSVNFSPAITENTTEYTSKNKTNTPSSLSGCEVVECEKESFEDEVAITSRREVEEPRSEASKQSIYQTKGTAQREFDGLNDDQRNSNVSKTRLNDVKSSSVCHIGSESRVDDEKSIVGPSKKLLEKGPVLIPERFSATRIGRKCFYWLFFV